MRTCLTAAWVALVSLTVIGEQALGTPPMIPQCGDCLLEPIGLSPHGGPTEFELSFTPKPDCACDSFIVYVKAAKRMTYAGPGRFVAHVVQGGRYSTKLLAVVADNDTSAILVEVCGLGCCVTNSINTIITIGDSVRVLSYLPTRGTEEAPPQRRIDFSKEPDQPSSSAAAQQREADSIRLFGQPTQDERRTLMRESRLKRMHELETEPLTELEAQVFTVDSVDYVRYRGETLFHVAVPVKDPLELSRHIIDSIAALPPELQCNVVLELNDTVKLELARKFIDSLTPANRPGFYLTRTTRAIIKRLSESGVRIGFMDQLPTGTFKPAKDTGK